MELKGCINWFYFIALYDIVRVAPVPYCEDQWMKSMSESVSATGPCKIEQKAGSAVDMYCDVDTSKQSSISWYHRFRSKWVPIVMENNSEWRPTVYLTNGNKNLTLLSSYIDDEYDEELDEYPYNRNTNGVYKCKARLGSVPDVFATRTIELDLYECAKRKNVFVHLTLNEVLIDLGGNVTSSCVVDYGCKSVEPYSADWYLRRGPNNTKVADLKGTRYQVDTTISNAGRHIVTTLMIRDVQKADFGDSFMCIVLNSSETNVNRLRIKRVDVVNKSSPFPLIQVLTSLPFLAAVVVVVLILWHKRADIGLCMKSRCYDTQPQSTNSIFILLDDEEATDKENNHVDHQLAIEITRRFKENYTVATSYTEVTPGHAESQNPFKGYSTKFIILPELENIKRIKEFDSCVSRLYNDNDISVRYLTIIDRNEVEMKEIPNELKDTFLLSKLLVHVTRPAKDDTAKQVELFYRKLKERTSPLPKTQKPQGYCVHLASQLCCCISDRYHHLYGPDDDQQPLEERIP